MEKEMLAVIDGLIASLGLVTAMLEEMRDKYNREVDLSNMGE